MMQNRDHSGNPTATNTVVVEDFDPLTINDNAASLEKFIALLSSHRNVRYFEAGRTYKYVFWYKEYEMKLVRALKIEEKPLVVDLNALPFLSAEEYEKFLLFLQHLKQHSINNIKNTNSRKEIIEGREYGFAHLGKDGVVTYSRVNLSDPLVVYQPKKDQADRRFAILGKKISSGSYGSLFASNRSLACSSVIIVNDKRPEKRRVVKIQNDKISRSRQALVADLEYDMTLALAPELAVKPLAKHTDKKMSAMLMRYVPGVDLLTFLNSRKLKSDLERLAICLSAAEGIKVVHDRGGIHRDVKPDNFIVVQCDNDAYRLQLIDYGLATLQIHENRGGAGSLTYMAPELLDGGNATIASDVYSLCRLIEVIFGYQPRWDSYLYSVHEAAKQYYINATIPFDVNKLRLDKSKRDFLDQLGLKALLDGMRKREPGERTLLPEVIKGLQTLIADLKTANTSQSIFPSAAAAARSKQVESDSCGNVRMLRK